MCKHKHVYRRSLGGAITRAPLLIVTLLYMLSAVKLWLLNTPVCLFKGKLWYFHGVLACHKICAAVCGTSSEEDIYIMPSLKVNMEKWEEKR